MLDGVAHYDVVDPLRRFTVAVGRVAVIGLAVESEEAPTERLVLGENETGMKGVMFRRSGDPSGWVSK